MKFGKVDLFSTYSPELSVEFQIPENNLLSELPLLKLCYFINKIHYK